MERRNLVDLVEVENGTFKLGNLLIVSNRAFTPRCKKIANNALDANRVR